MKDCACNKTSPCLNAAMAEIDEALDSAWRLDHIAFLGLGYAATAVRRRSNVQVRAKGLTIVEAIMGLAEAVRGEEAAIRS
jgi:hypothetical protein